MIVPDQPNQRWSLDFVPDAFTDGRRFRVLAVVDDHTRECLALIAETALSGGRVVREQDAVVARRGQPLTAASDNGTEFTSMAICGGHRTGRPTGTTSLRRVDAERIHGELQRQLPRRVPQ